MAKIPTYENKLFPDAAPLAVAARRTDILGDEQASLIRQSGQEVEHAVGQVEQGVAQSEIAKQANDVTATKEDLDNAWKEKLKTANPLDPHIASDFMQNYAQSRIDKLGEGWVTKAAQESAAKQQAILHMDMFQKTADDQRILTGHGAQMSLDNQGISLAKSVHDDPSSYDAAKTAFTASVDGYRKTGLFADEVEAAQAQKEGLNHIAYSGALGVIENDPVNGEEQARKAGFYDALTEQQQEFLSRQAERLQNAAIRDQESQDRLAKEQAVKQFTDYRTAIEKKYITPNADGTVTVAPGYFTTVAKTMIGDPSNRMPEMMAFGHTLEKVTPEDNKTDPGAFYALLAQMKDPQNPITSKELEKALSDHKLSIQGYDFFQQVITGKNQGVPSIIGNIINTLFGSGYQDPASAEAKQKILDMALTQAGQNLRDGKNPNDFLNPSDPSYILKPEMTKQMMPSPSQQAASMVRQNTIPPAGQTAAERQKGLEAIFGSKSAPPAKPAASEKSLPGEM